MNAAGKAGPGGNRQREATKVAADIEETTITPDKNIEKRQR